jgi:CheY-like chemotaxis protein
VRRLLIVDDDEAIRRLFRLQLADEYEIIDTADPEQALALAMEHKPDAILLDMHMPKFSGFDLCRTFNSFSQKKRRRNRAQRWVLPVFSGSRSISTPSGLAWPP